MAFYATVIADSITDLGDRLTTVEVCLPRPYLAELNTHRAFSRNSASSRAIPVAKQLAKIEEDPYIPLEWGSNQAGMQAGEELADAEKEQALAEWLSARDSAVRHAKRLLELGLHKQLTNRLLEPFMWQTVLITATDWRNFYALRANPQAQPEIRRAAELIRDAMDASTPQILRYGEWHLPLIQPDELEWAHDNVEDAIKVSVGRSARVSYLTHDGIRDHSKDIELFERLVSSGHMSPLEHVATPLYKQQNDGTGDLILSRDYVGNFRGWKQYRKMVPGEHDYSLIAA